MAGGLAVATTLHRREFHFATNNFASVMLSRRHYDRSLNNGTRVTVAGRRFSFAVLRRTTMILNVTVVVTLRFPECWRH